MTASLRTQETRTGPVGPPLLRLARPGQWVKNLLVLAVPAAAGALERGPVLAHALQLTVAFVLASVAVYAVNDVRDAGLDRKHPHKRLRPVASGAVSTRSALILAGCATIGALALAQPLGWAATLSVLAYLTVTQAYSLVLKHVAVLDIVAVAAGFVIRAIAGATPDRIPVSNWFLLVSLFGALYIVSGKRNAEAHRAGDRRIDEHRARPVLSSYPADWLQQVLTLSLAGTVISYAMWAFQGLGRDVLAPLVAASVIPFLIVLLQYGLRLARGEGERPESLLAGDPLLLGAGAVWFAMTMAGLYLA